MELNWNTTTTKKEIDKLNEQIDQFRPIDKDLLKQIKEYYRIALTYSSNAAPLLMNAVCTVPDEWMSPTTSSLKAGAVVSTTTSQFNESVLGKALIKDPR